MITTTTIRYIKIVFDDATCIDMDSKFLDLILKEFNRYTTQWFKRDRLVRVISDEGSDIYFPISTVTTIVVFFEEDEE